MAHNDSRINPVYDPDPCKYPVSRFPQGLGLSAGLERLIQWVDKGKVPPHADYVVVDNDLKNDGSVLTLDANGNPKGGVRSTYVDVPVNRYIAPNEPNPTPIPNPSPLTAAASVQLFCSIAGYEVPLPRRAGSRRFTRARRTIRQKSNSARINLSKKDGCHRHIRT